MREVKSKLLLDIPEKGDCGLNGGGGGREKREGLLDSILILLLN